MIISGMCLVSLPRESFSHSLLPGVLFIIHLCVAAEMKERATQVQK